MTARSFNSLSEALWVLFELPPCPLHCPGSVATIRIDRHRRLLGVVCAVSGPELPHSFQINGERVEPRFARRFALSLKREGELTIHILWFAFDTSFRVFAVRGTDGASRPVIHFGRSLSALDSDALAACKPPPARPLWVAWLSRLCRLAGIPRLIRLLGRKQYAGCWLFVDRGFMADDNAEHLYRWVMRHHPERRIKFALHRKSPDWDRLEREGFSLVDIASPRYLAACLNCDWLISSQRANYIAKHYWRRWHPDVTLYRFCFLQHGVTMNYMPRFNNPHADLLVSASRPEYQAFSMNPDFAYVYSGREARLTGFPRHDALLRKAEAHPKPGTVLIMPTWRHTLAAGQTGDGQFQYAKKLADTEFFHRWQSVLQAEPLLHTAYAYGYRVAFYPHPHLRPLMHYFPLAGVTVVSENTGSLQDILVDTALLITDYSSIAMETALLRRPVLYYQFDREDFFNHSHEQGRGRGYFDYERDGFGEVIVEEQALFRLAESYMRSGCRMKDVYLKRRDAFFPFNDRENCRRVYDALCEDGCGLGVFTPEAAAK